MSMKQISAARFKERGLGQLDEVEAEGIVITKRGKPVARLIPFDAGSVSLIGSLRGKVRLSGRLLSTGAKWDAQS